VENTPCQQTSLLKTATHTAPRFARFPHEFKLFIGVLFGQIALSFCYIISLGLLSDNVGG